MAHGNPRAAEFSEASSRTLVGRTGLGGTGGPIAAIPPSRGFNFSKRTDAFNRLIREWECVSRSREQGKSPGGV